MLLSSRSLAGSVSARRIARSKAAQRQREAVQWLPSPRRGSSWLVNTFFDAALWSIIITYLSPSEVVLFGRVCKAIAQACTTGSWATWWYRTQSAVLVPHKKLTATLAPALGEDWAWEHLHLCVELCQDLETEWTIEFWVASDQISPDNTCRSIAQVEKLDAIAAVLRRHPRLRIRVEGHAARDAPTIYGGPISQARATRVRTELLKRLRDQPTWNGEKESLGRGQSSMDAMDIEDTYLHYNRQELVGSKLQAIGTWRKDDVYFASQPSVGGQSAEVRIIGVESE